MSDMVVRFITRGTLVHIRSDNGPELAAIAVKDWIASVGAKTAYIESGSPWKNGYVQSFSGEFRDELLSCEIFNTLAEDGTCTTTLLARTRSSATVHQHQHQHQHQK